MCDDAEPVRIEITDVFDLHSVPPRDVKEIVEAYLEEAHAKGFTAIRLIHGRGIGVQRETVRAVLSRTPFVIDFRDAPARSRRLGRDHRDPSSSHSARENSRGKRRNYPSNFASRVIFAFSSFEIGHPSSAALAAFSNAAWSAPGIRARNSR